MRSVPRAWSPLLFHFDTRRRLPPQRRQGLRMISLSDLLGGGSGELMEPDTRQEEQRAKWKQKQTCLSAWDTVPDREDDSVFTRADRHARRNQNGNRP